MSESPPKHAVLNSRLLGHTLWLTMNQPENLNALGFDLVAALQEALTKS